MIRRRDLFHTVSTLAVATADSAVIDTQPLFPISPWLHMQFMEPLGATDSSVEAAWDYDRDDWREDFVALTRDLAPQVLRWGGLYSRYYRWREGIGAPDKRPWMRNYVWGGKETNRVGTGEFIDLCERVGAAPLMCVNFMGDGEARYRQAREGDRTAGPREAAEWVSYAPKIRLWQLGNETSYGNNCFPRDEAIARTIEFSKAMKARDRGIKLIAWGDRGSSSKEGKDGYWAPQMIERAGEHFDLIAFHMMGQSPQRKDTVLRGTRYQENPPQAWAELLELADRLESRLREMIAAAGPAMPVAITEGHLSLPPHNANPILLEWLSAAYHARSLNSYQRHGDRVKIATIADFEGNRWTVNALLLQTPGRVSYLTPAGAIARLFRKHNGTHAIAISGVPAGLDIAASASGNTVFLHVVNTEYAKAVELNLTISGRRVLSGRVHEIAPPNLRTNASPMEPEIFRPVEKPWPQSSNAWRFPAGSVSVVKLETAANA